MSEFFKTHADNCGDRAALVDNQGTTSWRELNARCNRLINGLRDRGVKPGGTFAVLSSNRREYFEIVAAGTQGGWRYVPINVHLQADEIPYILSNSEAQLLFLEEELADKALHAVERLSAPVDVVVIGASGGEGAYDYEGVLRSASDEEPDNQRLGMPMFYTSGTTGRPKGVVGSGAVVGGPLEVLRLMSDALVEHFGLRRDGAILLAGPLYHSVQWLLTVPMLLAGARIVIQKKFDAVDTLHLIDEYEINSVNLVPTQMVRLLRLNEEVRGRFDGSSLDCIWHGAAPCAPEVKRQMIEWMGPIVHEYYGATEGSIISVIRAGEWLGRPGSLGRPLPHIETIVVGDEGHRLGPDQVGELYFRNGTGADFEYFKDPDKTKTAHLEPGVFTFGDMGYLDEQGYLYLSDRKIDMIISGGVNIYPQEIENVLMTHPAVADVAVFGIPNQEFGEEVKAVVQTAKPFAPQSALEDELIAYCRARLARFKAPKSIDFRDTLGRQENGKIQKRVLRDPYWQGTERRI